MSTPNLHLMRAIEIFDGTQEEFGKELDNLSQSTISTYVTGRRKIPPKHCRKIQAMANNQVTIHQLRPDVFGDEPEALQAA